MERLDTPPPAASPEPSVTPLAPRPVRRPVAKPVFTLPDEDDDQPYVYPTAGISWFFQDENNPLPALYKHYSVSPSRETWGLLPETLDLECIPGGTLWPTHVLAVYPQMTTDDSSEGMGESYPLLIPIEATTWKEKTTVPLPPNPPGFTPPVPRRVAPPGPRRRIITLPIVPIEVPCPDAMPILLLFALGLESMLALFARKLLPPNVVGEFPDSDAMSHLMSQLPNDEIAQYLSHNRQLWRNSLKLGVLDRHIINMIEVSYRVTVRALDKQNSSIPPAIMVFAVD